MPTPALMLQGTGSNVGKSLLVTGLCRAFARRGLAVRPFKPQNMSNNAAVTADGGEIGRAQALQARACGVAPSVHMNPVLLKPQSEVGAQVVVQGRVLGNYDARAYFSLRSRLLPDVLASFEQVGKEADLVLVEGAGSPAEVNLRAGDIANMGFAEAADLPVVLVGDIERGGVIASLVGTHALLEPAERARLRGYVVNKFRGDPRLFDEAHAVIEGRTGMVSLGVVPWLERAAHLPAEDVLDLPRLSAGTAGGSRTAPPRQPVPSAAHPERDHGAWSGHIPQGSPPPDVPPAPSGERPQSAKGDDRSALRRAAPRRAVRIAVPRLPRIANFDDLDPLAMEPGVRLDLVAPGTPLAADADLVILPGSKATLADLAALRAEGWDIDLLAHVRRGGHVLGICGGFQMLGRELADSSGIEGPPATAAGLGLLDLETTLGGDKRLVEVAGRELASGAPIRGYEMHLGQSAGPALARPMLDLDGRVDGAVSADGRVMGCYVHGLFASDGFRSALLARISGHARSGLAYEAEVEATLDALAGHLEAHLDLDRLLAIARSV